ncbi:MAG: hypothetical protein KJ624_01100 [Chloroflexi bacterium]|nr:hypothetical protein [Chloroflexota bacterium]
MPELVIGLVLGFVSKLLYDELKSPRVELVSVSREAFHIGPITQVPGGFDNDYNAYRLKVENHQKGFLDCAAENCVAWLLLDSAPEAYQLCWVGGASELTLNVGDMREVDTCARGIQTGVVVAPTEIGYSKSSLRKIGDGSRDLHGTIRITCKNGKKAEKRIAIRPVANCQLDISLA